MSKHWSRKPNQNAEVCNARNQLDGLLKTLVDKKDEENDADEDLSMAEMSSVTSSPGKRGPTRKRKRGHSVPEVEEAQLHQSYVTKLFDRSVNLAIFSEDCPLYPICRCGLILLGFVWIHVFRHV